MKVSSWQNNSYNWGLFHCQVWLEGNPNMLIPSSHLSCSDLWGKHGFPHDWCLRPIYFWHIPCSVLSAKKRCILKQTLHAEVFTKSVVTLHIRKNQKSVVHWYHQLYLPVVEISVETRNWTWIALGIETSTICNLHDIFYVYICIVYIYINTRSIIAYSICF